MAGDWHIAMKTVGMTAGGIAAPVEGYPDEAYDECLFEGTDDIATIIRRDSACEMRTVTAGNGRLTLAGDCPADEETPAMVISADGTLSPDRIALNAVVKTLEQGVRIVARVDITATRTGICTAADRARDEADE